MRKHCPRPSIMAIKNQKRVVIWAKRALKSFVGVPTPSGFDAKSNALNLASSNCSACCKTKTKTKTTKIDVLSKGKAHNHKIKCCFQGNKSTRN